MWEGQGKYIHETQRHSLNNHVYNGMTVVLRIKLGEQNNVLNYIHICYGDKLCTLLYMQLRTLKIQLPVTALVNRIQEGRYRTI